jgi:hypothetical protein
MQLTDYLNWKTYFDTTLFWHYFDTILTLFWHSNIAAFKTNYKWLISSRSFGYKLYKFVYIFKREIVFIILKKIVFMILKKNQIILTFKRAHQSFSMQIKKQNNFIDWETLT